MEAVPDDRTGDQGTCEHEVTDPGTAEEGGDAPQDPAVVETGESPQGAAGGVLELLFLRFLHQVAEGGALRLFHARRGPDRSHLLLHALHPLGRQGGGRPRATTGEVLTLVRGLADSPGSRGRRGFGRGRQDARERDHEGSGETLGRHARPRCEECARRRLADERAPPGSGLGADGHVCGDGRRGGAEGNKRRDLARGHRSEPSARRSFRPSCRGRTRGRHPRAAHVGRRVQVCEIHHNKAA